jgi:hypothetical protein
MAPYDRYRDDEPGHHHQSELRPLARRRYGYDSRHRSRRRRRREVRRAPSALSEDRAPSAHRGAKRCCRVDTTAQEPAPPLSQFWVAITGARGVRDPCERDLCSRGGFGQSRSILPLAETSRCFRRVCPVRRVFLRAGCCSRIRTGRSQGFRALRHDAGEAGAGRQNGCHATSDCRERGSSPCVYRRSRRRPRGVLVSRSQGP